MKFTSFLDDFIHTYFRKELSPKFFLGFTCGIPFLLRLAVLDLWLKDFGLSNTAIGFITLIQCPYIFKFLWAPFTDRFDFPVLSRLLNGRKRGWAFASQLLLFAGILGMASSSPQDSLYRLLIFASIVAFADGIQDVSIFPSQWDNVSENMKGPTAGIFVFGYRLGLFFSKSLTLYLAHYLGWNYAYAVMAFSIFLCTFFILKMPEPPSQEEDFADEIKKPFSILIPSTISKCLIDPFKQFLKKDHWRELISLLLLYRLGDIMFQKMSKLFYVDIGFSILDIANVVQVFGSIASLPGGIIGGYIITRIGITRAMMWFTSIHACCCCVCYVALAQIGKSFPMLYLSVFMEHVTIGAVTTVFVAFMYSISGKRHTSTQYALLWAFNGISNILYRSISGGIADVLGWTNFFLLLPLLIIPSLVILQSLKKDQVPELNECCKNT
ncbi:MAG: MFS transporter [Alphaproteobacteria bacterium]|nr:MFS transporter [Alphaproteobacteria bacterium]